VRSGRGGVRITPRPGVGICPGAPEAGFGTFRCAIEEFGKLVWAASGVDPDGKTGETTEFRESSALAGWATTQVNVVRRVVKIDVPTIASNVGDGQIKECCFEDPEAGI
jgi:hypothetical protein